MRKLIKKLQKSEGNATSMISLVIAPGSQISQTIGMLSNEIGTAENIKSRVNKLSVLSAITSVIQKLKLYTRVPENGLIVYCGNVIAEDGKEKKVIYDIEPPRAINTSMYKCDNKFHIDVLANLMTDNTSYGIIVMDGNGVMYAKISGNTKVIIHKFDVDLPKKHGRGGQSSVRFARLRLEKRHNYVRKVAEEANRIFITDDKVNVNGLILAGSAEFKNVLSESELLDMRIRKSIIKIVDIAYGGENGLNQTIEISQDVLVEVKLVKEKQMINTFFEEIRLDSGKICYNIKDTMSSLEMGAVEKLIIYEDLNLPSPNPNYETLVEFLVEKYIEYGTTLCLVSDKTQEGAQFVNGFGGLGGILRYKVDFDLHEEQNTEEVYDLDAYI